ncbi:hypothetical protein WB401_33975 [Streptomyces brasiliscabiei]|uniref:Integral membrane protein n=2 Tax=Streptomyces TaxID=1883 RepID=A0ABU8GRV4_9ACTN|nr:MULTISPECIES: hypothetical protein [Streptomyces]MBZ3907991.1 hypothetical protein [Streptomyces griseiscabiei]MDX2915140.1 hypothetical protein [Streptomyces griseiscabiei]
MLALLGVLLFFAAFFLLVIGLPTMRGPERPALPWRILYASALTALLVSAGLAFRADLTRCRAEPEANDCGTSDMNHP